MVNFENGASGKTPINKTNLNKMQTDLQNQFGDFYLKKATNWINMGDSSSETYTFNNNKIYFLFNTHVSHLSGYLIIYYKISNTVEYFNAYNVFGEDNITFSHSGGGTAKVSTTLPCRGKLFQFEPITST